MEQVIEEHFADYLQNNLEGAITDYRRRNCKLLDTDQARYLSTVWSISKRGRAVFSAAVHNPSSALVKELYKRALAMEDGRIVVFTAGGGGSGKSVAGRALVTPLMDEARVVYDTTFSNFESAVKKIDQALQHGTIVVVVFVYRPFESAENVQSTELLTVAELYRSQYWRWTMLTLQRFYLPYRIVLGQTHWLRYAPSTIAASVQQKRKLCRQKKKRSRF